MAESNGDVLQQAADNAREKPHAVDLRDRGHRSGRRHPVSRPQSALGQEIGSVTLKRSELVHGATTGAPAEFKTRFPMPEDRVRAEQGTEVVIKAETVKEYTTFLNSYVADLADMANQPDPSGAAANALEAFLQPDLNVPAGDVRQRQSRKLLVDLLTDKIADETGRTITRRVNEGKIKDYLLKQGDQQGRHWALVTMLMEEDGVWTQAAGGIDALVRSHKFNKQKNDPLTGRKRRTIHDEISNPRRLGRTALSVTETAVAGAAWWLFGRGRQEFKFESENDLLQQMKNFASPAERLYLRIKTGIDLDRINADGTYTQGYEPNPEAIYTKLDNIYTTRNDFLKQFGFDERSGPFGVDRSNRIRLPGEFIPAYRGNHHRHPEGLPMRYSMEVMYEYGEMPNPDPTTLTDDREANYVRLSLAYEKVMTRYMQQDIALQQAAEHVERQQGTVSALKTKREKMNTPENFREEQRAIHLKAKEKAQKGKREAEENKKTLQEGAGSLDEADNAVKEIENKLSSGEFGVVLTDDVDSAVTSRITQLKADRNQAHIDLVAQLSNHAVAVRQAADPYRQSWQAAITSLAGAKTIGTTPDLNATILAITKPIDAQYAVVTAPLQSNYDKLSKQVADLEAEYKAYQNAIYARDEITLRITAREPGQLQSATDAYNTFTVTLPGTSDEVRDLPVDTLVERLTTANIGNTPEERQRLVLQAKAQEEINRIAQIPAYQQDAITVFGGLTPPIVPDEILRMSKDELFIILRGYHVAAGTTNPDETARLEVRAARQGLSSRLRALVESKFTQEITYYDAIIKTADTQLESLTDLEPQKAELDVALRIVGDQLETYERASMLADDNDAVQRLIGGPTTIDPTDATFTQIERDAGYPREVLEWYQLLDTEYIRQENRDSAFRALQRLLPPQRLAALVNQHLRRPVTAPGLQQTVQEIINYVRDHSLAL